MREETRCHYMGYSFQLAERVILYASSHRQGSTYTSCGALAGTMENWKEIIYLMMHSRHFIYGYMASNIW